MRTEWVDRKTLECEEHGELSRSDRHDAYFCEECDRWAEDRCSDPHCGYCSERPDRPSEVTNEDG